VKPCVFIHTNHKQYIGALVSQYSFKRNSPNAAKFDVNIIHSNDHPFLRAKEGQSFLRAGGMRVWRMEDLQSFTPLRFMPPELMGYQGRAVVIDPDVFAFGGHPENHIEMVKVASELGFNPDAIVIHWGVETSDFLNGAETRAEYVWGATPWLPFVKHEDPLWGDARGAVEGFVERYDHPPDYTEAASAATGVVYMEALKQIDSDGPPLDQSEKDALVQALEDIEIETFFGPVDFEESGEFMHDNTLARGLAQRAYRPSQVVAAQWPNRVASEMPSS
jgi:hypothetical protein